MGNPAWVELATALEDVLQTTATNLVNTEPGEYYAEKVAYSMGKCYGMKWGLEYIRTRLDQVEVDIEQAEAENEVEDNEDGT